MQPPSIMGDCALCEVEEAGEVDTDHGLIVLQRVLGERLGRKDAGVVHECVDPS